MVALDIASGRPPEQGDLSLALAGAELIDLLGAQAIRLDGERIAPLHRPATGDRLLDEAASSLVRHEPHESVGDWLRRRGRGLFSSYLAALEAEGQVTQKRLRWRPFRTSRTVLVDSPAHREATKRWTADDAVLAALAATVGIHRERTADSPSIADDAVTTVLAAVNDAVMELGLARQRQDIEEAAFDNSAPLTSSRPASVLLPAISRVGRRVPSAYWESLGSPFNRSVERPNEAGPDRRLDWRLAAGRRYAAPRRRQPRGLRRPRWEHLAHPRDRLPSARLH
jgi:hypothetical protein